MYYCSGADNTKGQVQKDRFWFQGQFNNQKKLTSDMVNVYRGVSLTVSASCDQERKILFFNFFLK